MVDKRKSVAGGDVINLSDDRPDEPDVPATKSRRLADDRVAVLPQGANLVECDGKSCTHEVAWPPGMDGSTRPPTCTVAPAREYPFKLDPFQQTAINALEAGAGLKHACRKDDRPEAAIWVMHHAPEQP